VQRNNGYGLGLYGREPFDLCIFGGIAIFVLQIWGSRVWIARHATGLPSGCGGA
jgi:uncharacterized membrane protein YeiB